MADQEAPLAISTELKAVVGRLTTLDDKYMELEKEYNRKVRELQREYTELQRPLLEERGRVLAEPAEAPEAAAGSAALLATPACPGFWLQALKNLPVVSDDVEEHDMDVLEYLRDLRTENLDADDPEKGFKLIFDFAENPFFSNKEPLTRTYHTSVANPYTQETEVLRIVGTKIDWLPGKDVTVEVTKKKVKGGGAKKAKAAAKEKVEARESFFRYFFRDLEQDGEVPEGVVPEEAEEELDEEELLEQLMDEDHQKGECIRDTLIPFAVRWFTGEACPDEDDEDDDEEFEEEAPPSAARKKAAKKGGS